MLSEHFSESEFWCRGGDACGCNHSLKVDPRLIELLEQLRENIGGLPLHINSGYRCETWNRCVGGVPNSQHTKGTAADVACPNGLTMPEFLWYVEQMDWDGIGYYPYSQFIHCDVREGGVGAHIYWEG